MLQCCELLSSGGSRSAAGPLCSHLRHVPARRAARQQVKLPQRSVAAAAAAACRGSCRAQPSQVQHSSGDAPTWSCSLPGCVAGFSCLYTASASRDRRIRSSAGASSNDEASAPGHDPSSSAPAGNAAPGCRPGTISSNNSGSGSNGKRKAFEAPRSLHAVQPQRSRQERWRRKGLAACKRAWRYQTLSWRRLRKVSTPAHSTSTVQRHTWAPGRAMEMRYQWRQGCRCGVCPRPFCRGSLWS